MNTYIKGKLHNIRVTDASVDYNGSVTISKTFLDEIDVKEFEQCHVINLENGNRWITYALASEKENVFTVNGGGAHLAQRGDRCVVIFYNMQARFFGARRMMFADDNTTYQIMKYESS